jgi:putative sigma-54 modulation protein
VNITIEARHMEVTDAIRQYAESKVEKLPKYYDNIQSIEVVIDMDGGQPSVEIIVQARRKSTFVAHHRDADLYAGIDECVDKVSQQLRRHKDKVRDRQGAPHNEIS